MRKTIIKEIEKCRVCGSKNLTPILSLGEQYVTNFIEDPKQEALKAPLGLVLCRECSLLQMRHTLKRDVLYRRYWYRSGINPSMVEALADVAHSAERMVSLSKGDIVIDIGSNDGTLLKQYKTDGIARVGFEPSDLWTLAESDKTIKTIHDYFNHGSFKRNFPGKKAKIITAIAMFYDLDDPNGFVEDIKKCLDPNGVWIIQMNYLGLMLKNNTFDNISHEHLEFYSLTSLEFLLHKHNLEVCDVRLNDVNGGSFRVYVTFKHNREIPDRHRGFERVNNLRMVEEKEELTKVKTYLLFARRINKIKRDLLRLLTREEARGKRIFIYGASTRGLVVLQYAGIDNKLIEAAVDKNPDKWGKYIVGTGIPIIPQEGYRKRKPDYLFVLPYHFIEGFKIQERDFLDSGGRMIVAIPSVKVISKAVDK